MNAWTEEIDRLRAENSELKKAIRYCNDDKQVIVAENEFLKATRDRMKETGI